MNIKPMMREDELQMPACHSAEKVLLMADRHTRASMAMSEWATGARRCVDFHEGKQWSEEALRKLDEEERPAFTFNKIAPLVRLVLGYHRNNRVDAKLLPGYDGSGTKEVADCITRILKISSEMNQEPYVDAEVFLDGIVGGRGFYDVRLDFERNMLGEMKITARDPFSIKLDPEADSYDLNEHGFIQEDRWVSIDEVEFTYGRAAAALIAPMVRASGYMGGIQTAIMDLSEEIAPWRTFGGTRGTVNPYMPIDAFLAAAFDPSRKQIKLVDCQHKIRVIQRCFVDLETGAKEPIPDQWDTAKIQRVLQWAEIKYRDRRQANPLRMRVQPMLRTRWTTMIGDLVVFDNWSPYESYTLTGFFPYFRRGKTRGMVDDLIDPQQEINKRRSAQIDIVTRTAHSGWMYHENGLDKEGKENIEINGAVPGVNIKWKGESHMKPERIMPATPPMAMERLENKGNDDLKEISGINDSALGQLDRVQSGRALEARQRQSVIAIQPYMDNMTRTKELLARKKVEIVQNHYTEKRIYRTYGDDGRDSVFTINAKNAAGEVVNNVTDGRYAIVIDETPLAASFISAQFEEMLDLAEKGILPLSPTVKAAIVDASSIPQKDAIKAELQASAKAPAPTEPTVEAANIRAEASVKVAKIDSATQLAIHGMSIEQAGAEADMQAAQPPQQPQEGIAA